MRAYGVPVWILIVASSTTRRATSFIRISPKRYSLRMHVLPGVFREQIQMTAKRRADPTVRAPANVPIN